MVGQSTRFHPQRSGSAGRWLLVALLAVIAGTLLIELGMGIDPAHAQPGASLSRRNVFAVAGEIAPDTRGIYLVDLDHGTICVYQYVPGARQLKMCAARTFVFDVQLEDYNNAEPLPREVREIVEKQRSLEDVSSSPQ